jgi:hypothetical protein
MDRGEKWQTDNMTALTELLVSRAPLRSKEAVLGLARYRNGASSHGQDYPRLFPRQIAQNLAKFEEKVFQFVKLFPISLTFAVIRSLRLAVLARCIWFWTTRYDSPNNGNPYSLEHGHGIRRVQFLSRWSRKQFGFFPDRGDMLRNVFIFISRI